MTDITPPPELVEEWANDSVPMNANAIGRDWERAFAARAAQWGADQELEACCEWVSKYLPYLGAFPMPEDALRAARRPKPPSLKEQGFAALELLKQRTTDPNIIEPLSRALEALPE